MWVDVGSINSLKKGFEAMVYRKSSPWNYMIISSCEAGMHEEALSLYNTMPRDDLADLNGRAFVSLIKACAKTRDIKTGFVLHVHAAEVGCLESDLYIGNNLIDMYFKHELFTEARRVFHKLPYRDVVSWTTMITRYAEHGHGAQAVGYFKNMEAEGICPNIASFVSILKVCGNMYEIEKGKEIHADIERKGLNETETFVGSALVDMYGKCGAHDIAELMFEKLHNRDVVSWTALITGYAEYGYGEEAIECFERMQLEGVFPNYVTFVSILKACSFIGDISKGIEIHTEVERKGLLHVVIVANLLVDMYVKFGMLGKAQEVFNVIQVRDVVSWTTLLAGYAESGNGKEALESLEQMQLEGIVPNTTTLICGLNACGGVGALQKGQEIHLEIERRGLVKQDPAVGNALMDMYAKCGSLKKAQKLFRLLPDRNTVTWNTLITGYAEHDQCNEALKCVNQMREEGFYPDHITFIYVLKACSKAGQLEQGRQTHAEVERQGLLYKDHSLGNALVEMYSRGGWLIEARQVLDVMMVRNTACWNVLMEGYIEHGWHEEVLSCFEEMKLEGVSPNVVTYLCSLRACGYIGATCKGDEIYDQIERKGLLDKDGVGNSLMNIYAKSGLLERAEQEFDKLSVHNVVSWNTMISGYLETQNAAQALKFFAQMKLECIFPNVVTYVCSMRACSMISDASKGREICAEIERFGCYRSDLAVHNRLINIDTNCSLLDLFLNAVNNHEVHCSDR